MPQNLIEMKRIVISDESINSYGFWVLTDGIDLSAFVKNPVMLWNHNRDDRGTADAQLPIGIWKDLRVENGVLTGEPVFDETDEFAVKIKKKYEAGILNACSMGFMPIEWSDAPEMLKEGQTVATVTRCRLMEVSICDIPSNANATVVLYDENSKTINLSALPGLRDTRPRDCETTDIRTNKQPADARGASLQNNNDMPKEIAQKLGLDENASPQDCVAAIQKKDDEIATLKAKVKGFEEAKTNAQKEEAKKLLDDAVKTGRIDATARPQFEKLFELDHDGTKAALAALPERKPLQTSNSGGSHDDRAGWTYLDWMKKDPDGLRKMKTEDPDRFKTLQQTLNKKH